MLIVLLRRTFVTVWFWLGTSLATLITGLMIICHLPFKKVDHDLITRLIESVMARFIYNWMSIPRFWSYHIVYESKEVKEEMVNNFGAFILASNHTAIIDTLFMAMLPSKKTYTYNLKWSKVPVFGWLCLWAGYIGIDTSSKEAKAKVVGRVTERVKQGYSVMIYPEGKRSQNPRKLISPLKTGAFRVARESERPILPLVFQGMTRAISRRGIADIATMRLIICKPQIVGKETEIKDAIEKFRQVVDGHLEPHKSK